MTPKKHVLLFGAGGYVGKAFVESLADIFQITKVFNRSGGGLVLDFLKVDAIEPFAKQISSPLDAIVFAQGINPSQGADAITPAHFLEMLQVNLVGPTFLVRSLVAKMNSGASVVFLSSVAKVHGSYDPAYGAAKAGILGLMQSLANAYPSVRFNAVSPGLIEGSPVYRTMSAAQRQKHCDRTTGGKLPQVGEIVQAIAKVLQDDRQNRTDVRIDHEAPKN